MINLHGIDANVSLFLSLQSALSIAFLHKALSLDLTLDQTN